MFDRHIDSTYYWIIKFAIFTLYTHYIKFFEQCIIMSSFFLFTYVNTEFSENFLEISGKYLKNESGIWLATLCKLNLNSFILETLKEFQLKCDLYTYTEMLINTDMLAFLFWLKCISSLFKWTIIVKIKQNVH